MALMMRRLSEKAGLGRVFTNHSVRATCITKLAKGGASDSVIMATSGHRRAESLLSYNRHSEEQRQRTAAILDDDDLDLDDVNKAIALATPDELMRLEQPLPLLPAPESRRMEAANSSATPAVPMNFGGASFSGCTFHFSISSSS